VGHPSPTRIGAAVKGEALEKGSVRGDTPRAANFTYAGKKIKNESHERLLGVADSPLAGHSMLS
jgi:hypothetical protein